MSLGLEFMIVVLGILVGLQVDDWNSRRIALKSESGYLERLSREVDENLRVYGEMIEWLEQREADLRAYYRSLTGEEAERPTEETLRHLFCHPGFVYPVTYDNSVLEEMLGSGLLARLQDPSLRAALAQYRSNQNQWGQLLVDSSENFKSIFDFVDQFREWRLATAEGGFGNCDIDFEALESHPRSPHMIANYQRHRLWQRLNNAEIHRSLMQIRSLLATAP